jgi:hypothetical protein
MLGRSLLKSMRDTTEEHAGTHTAVLMLRDVRAWNNTGFLLYCNVITIVTNYYNTNVHAA